MLEAKRVYNKNVQKAKQMHYIKEKNKVTQMTKHSPKEFWRYIKKQNNKRGSIKDISIQDFYNHFCNMSTTDYNENVHQYANEQTSIKALDKHNTHEEVMKAIQNLCRGKRSGLDELIDEIFVAAKEILASYLVKIFNLIFSDNTYQTEWSKGYIIPIPKKGDLTDVNNYRGINSMGVFAKLFSIILNNRLTQWCENRLVYNECQFGFREHKSTTNSINILQSLISKALDRNEKSYCAFVDYKKAFGLVIREELWFKLQNCSISTKMMNILKSMSLLLSRAVLSS